MGTNINAAKRYSNISLPFTCPINNREFNSTQGLATYISRTLKMEHKEYYDKYIHHRDSSCFFCGDEGLFMSVGKGYRNLCQNPNCLKKSFVSHSVEGIMYRDLISREEAELKFIENNSNQLEKRTQTFEKLRTDDKDWDKKRSRNCKEFYLNKGFTEEESINKAKEAMDDIHKKTFKKFKDDPEKYASKNPTKIEYYLKRGFSEKDASEKLSERQTTFSKEICIDKYGEENGLKIWQDRQNKWMKTLDEKTDDEKLIIKYKKLFNKSGYSKSSQKLFWNIYEYYKDPLDIKFEELNGEVVRYDKINKKHYKYDYVDFKRKKVIEFNGDFWHCNPLKYNEDFTHKILKKTAKEIWNNDRIKNTWFENRNYKVLVIWESEFTKNPKETIQKCLDFLNT